MSDFLTRLAVRALQRPSLVPRLLARFDAPVEPESKELTSAIERALTAK